MAYPISKPNNLNIIKPVRGAYIEHDEIDAQDDSREHLIHVELDSHDEHENHYMNDIQLIENEYDEINELDELQRQCDTLQEHCYEILGSRDINEQLQQQDGGNRFSNNNNSGAMIFHYGSETSINTVISNPCSDTSSQNTQNSSECSSGSLNITMDNSFGSSETSLDRDPVNKKLQSTDSLSSLVNEDAIDLKWDIIRGQPERHRKKKSSKSSNSDKSSSGLSRNGDKSSILHLNLNIRKIISKLKTKNTDKKTKTKKSKGSSISSTNSDDSGPITTVYSASHVEWYTNLFKECQSSDSSDSEDESPKSKKNKVKRTNSIRGKISVDFEMHKEKIVESDRSSSSDNDKNIAKLAADSKNTMEIKTKGSYANIRKTNTVELQQKGGLYKSARRKCITSGEHTKNNLNHFDTLLRNCEENNNINMNMKNENTLCRSEIDLQKTPLISRYARFSSSAYCTDDINGNLRTQPSNHYERRPYSACEEQYRGNSHDQQSYPKMIASFDFIASEDLEVTVLTGQQVEILLKPDPDWWLVRTPEGKEGFVPKNFLNVIPTVPSRKSDLIKKLMSLTYNPDIDIFDKPDPPKPDNRNQVMLPNRIRFSDSPRLAKVAPLLRDTSNDEIDVAMYQLQKEAYHDIKTNTTGGKRLPPPSYTEHINNTLSDMIEQYCDFETDQSSTSICDESCEEEETKMNSAPTPRVLRRRSFSGNKQKKVHFSNKIATAYLKDSPEYNTLSDRYGLDASVSSLEPDAVSYC